MNQSYRNFKRNRYRDALPAYGFYTLVYLIDQYEKEENYEECQIILDVILEANEDWRLDLPTKFDVNAVIYLQQACQKMNITSNSSHNNLEYYADKVKQMTKIDRHESKHSR